MSDEMGSEADKNSISVNSADSSRVRRILTRVIEATLTAGVEQARLQADFTSDWVKVAIAARNVELEHAAKELNKHERHELGIKIDSLPNSVILTWIKLLIKRPVHSHKKTIESMVTTQFYNSHRLSGATRDAPASSEHDHSAEPVATRYDVRRPESGKQEGGLETMELETMKQNALAPLSEDELWHDVLERFKEQPINAAFAIRKYQETVRDRPLLRLLQDVNQRIGIYTNILEEIKRQPLDETAPNPTKPTSTQLLRAKYEGLGLVPKGHLPNPWGAEAAEFALKKLRNYGTLLVEIMATCAEAIAVELRVSVNVSFKVSVNVSLSPSINLGVERAGKE